MDQSILGTIKKMLGVEDDSFDVEIIVHINAALMQLGQLGIGSKEYFSVVNSSTEWSDFISNKNLVSGAKDYVYVYVRTVFDPPTSSFVLAAMQEQLKEIGYRLSVEANKEGTKI